MQRTILQIALAFLFAAVAAAGPDTAHAFSPKTSEAAGNAPECLSSWTDAESGDTLCVRKETFNRDLCGGIEYFAGRHAMPVHFFARLIWRESLFRPAAVSPKGAEGIAQFMPATARLRGLTDSFDVLAALDASARYLSELNQRFDGFGQAAAAYNAGEAGFARFLDKGRLPHETRAYVIAITGHTVEQWTATPPDLAAPPLDGDTPFLESCVALAESRRLSPGTLAAQGPWAPWGVQLAAHASPTMARALFARAAERLPEALKGELPVIVHQKRGNFGHRGRYAVRIGRDTRAEANEVCATIRSAGGACTVFRN